MNMMILTKILLTTALLPLLAVTMPLEWQNDYSDINPSIVDAVEHCFYEVERSKVQQAPECADISAFIDYDRIEFGVPCRDKCKYPSRNHPLRDINTALAVHIVLRHEKEDNQLALECAYLLRIPLDYSESHYTPLECQAIWHQDNLAARQITRPKRYLALVKYFATAGWFSSDEIFDENRKAAVDCYGLMRNDSSVRYESCRGITWTGIFRRPTPPAEEQYPEDMLQYIKDDDDYEERMQWPERKAYYREMVHRVPKPGRYVHMSTESNFTPEELVNLAEEYEETAEFKQDSALVEYCYFEPQNSKNLTYLEQCAGIAFDRPKKITTLKQAKIMRHLDFYDSMFKSHRSTQQKLIEQGRFPNVLPQFEQIVNEQGDKEVTIKLSTCKCETTHLYVSLIDI